MSLSQEDAFAYIQRIFQRGLVTVVGSGASCAYGLPSMGQLAEHLVENVPKSESFSQEFRQAWQPISDELANGAGLETALLDTDIPDELASEISRQIASAVSAAEAEAIESILNTNDPAPFGRLFQYVLRNNEVADVITTNYDRLLEVAAAHASVRLDTMYYGHTIGRLDESLSRDELTTGRPNPARPSLLQIHVRPHIRLSKPHGSLDWYCIGGQNIRSELPLAAEQQIVAPGSNKYRAGYDIAFDRQRRRANDAIGAASAMLFIGFGFNDDHLQTYIRNRFTEVPSVVISHRLTDKAMEFLAMNDAAIGIQCAPDGQGARLHRGDAHLDVEAPIWQLEALISEVL